MLSDDVFALPVAPPSPRRPAVPVLASLAPVLGGVALWLITGSMFALWFAVLGPVIALGGLLDSLRARRRERRRHEREYALALQSLRERLDASLDRRRTALEARHPDVAGFASAPDEVWRPVPERAATVIVGRGDRESGIAVGGDPAGRDAAARLRADANVLRRVPVTVPWRDGLAVRGPGPLAEAVARALLIQLCLIHPPTALRIVGTTPEGWGWVDRLPHRGDDTEGDGGALRLCLGAPRERAEDSGDVVLAWHDEAGALDPRCAALIEAGSPLRAELRIGTVTKALEPEALGSAQAAAIASSLAARARALDPSRPRYVADVREMWRADGVGVPGRLVVALGMGQTPVLVDLVGDGPHAVVAGVTGAGKSELLTTWITSLCRAYTTAEVTFLLADFKGGVSFDALSALPHVTGVITDLDGDGAERAISSLRAEMRRRERILAGAGVRHIAEAGLVLPRLVVVVDEFAALVSDLPDLQRVFTDIAARGRALGIHLILGTQRVTGVVREGILANAPLRIALRAADDSDSRTLLGTPAAARLPGGEAARGRALIRRAADSSPVIAQIPRTAAEDLATVVAEVAHQERPRASWLPPLPSLIRAGDLPAEGKDTIPLGIADDPAAQSRRGVGLRVGERGLVVVGGAGSGKSAILRLVASHDREATILTQAGEAAWDAVARGMTDPPRILLVDDVDRLLAGFGHDYAAELTDRLEALIRMAGNGGPTVVLTTRRVSGAVARLVEGLPRRVVLGFPSRAEHVAAGGDGHSFAARGPGRGVLDGLETQFGWTPHDAGAAEASPEPAAWLPARHTAVIARDPHGVRARLREAWTGTGVPVLLRADAAASGDPALEDPRRVVVGEPAHWQAHWRDLQRAIAEGQVVVDASCPDALRSLLGERDLPPWAQPGAGRAWLWRAGRGARRVLLTPAKR